MKQLSESGALSAAAHRAADVVVAQRILRIFPLGCIPIGQFLRILILEQANCKKVGQESQCVYGGWQRQLRHVLG